MGQISLDLPDRKIGVLPSGHPSKHLHGKHHAINTRQERMLCAYWWREKGHMHLNEMKRGICKRGDGRNDSEVMQVCR